METFLLIYIAIGITFICAWVIPKNQEKDVVTTKEMKVKHIDTLLPNSPIELQQYKGFVIKTWQIKGRWSYRVLSNDRKKAVLGGDSFGLDKRSLEELRKAIKSDIDQYLKNKEIDD